MKRCALALDVKRSVLALALASAFAAQAQIVPATGAGALGTAVSTGPAFSITGGTPQGSNLFHSFNAFNINTGQSATFTGPGSYQNIISRVTGDGATASNINGLLRSTFSGANLWLINPKGINFGPAATLDIGGAVGGSFHASTASYLKLGTGGRFDAGNPGASVLTTDAPSAFGFLDAPAAITVDRSQLKVGGSAPSLTLSLVGGNLSITGTSPFVRPGTASTPTLWAHAGRVNLASVGSAGEVTLTAGGIGVTPGAATGNISIVNATVLTEASTVGPVPGPIFIRGGRLTTRDSAISTLRGVTAPGADIDITLDGDMEMKGGILRASSVTNVDAGNVTIRAANVTLDRGADVAGIETSAFDFVNGTSGGRSGQISIDASGDVLLAGGSALTNISYLSTNPAGDTRINARGLAVTDNSTIQVSTFGDGDAGSVRISVQDLKLSRGGRIDANSEFDLNSVPGQGAGGSIFVDASNSVDIGGSGSGLFSKTTSFGPGGSITVTAPEIRIHDGGRISSQSVDVVGAGTGDAGSIQINAARALRVDSGGAISTESEGAGGGRITIKAGDLLSLDNGRITTSVSVGGGNGGDINIDPVFTILNASDIIARAVDGNGGNIFIVTQFLLLSPDSSIDATSQRGISGTVQISSPASDVGSRLGVLSSAYVDASALLRAACAARAGRPSSSFVGVGRGGLPASPDSAAYASYGSGSAASAAWQGMTVRAASCPGPQVG